MTTHIETFEAANLTVATRDSDQLNEEFGGGGAEFDLPGRVLVLEDAGNCSAVFITGEPDALGELATAIATEMTWYADMGPLARRLAASEAKAEKWRLQLADVTPTPSDDLVVDAEAAGLARKVADALEAGGTGLLGETERVIIYRLLRAGRLEAQAPDSGYCAWCEEAQAPRYLAHEGHDPECPLQPAKEPR